MDKLDRVEIPPFKNYAEEAEFWDTHNSLEFIEPGTKPFVYKGNKEAKHVYLTKEPLEGSINIRFSQQDLEALPTIANAKGLGPTTLVRMWTKEKLQEETYQSRL